MSMKLEDRGGRWHVVGTINGRRVRRSTGLPATPDYKRAAQRKLAEWGAEAAEGLSRRSRLKVSQALDQYESRVGGLGSTERVYLRKLREGLGSTHIDQLSAKKLNDYAKDRGVSAASARRELIVLKSAIRKADPQAEILSYALPKDSPKRVRYLRDEERERLIAECDEWLRPLVVFLLYTGARLGEALALTTDRVDEHGVRLTTRKTRKGESTRSVPLHSRVVLPEPRGRRYFPYQKRTVQKAFERARKRAGVEDFTVHDCRHDFASRLRQKGEGLDVIQALLGHESLAMVQRYAHLGRTQTTDAVNRL